MAEGGEDTEHRLSEVSDGSDKVSQGTNEDDSPGSSAGAGAKGAKGKGRKSSFAFDEYKFQNPMLEDNDDANEIAENEAEKEAERFMKMARFKTDAYSKMDVVRMASSMGGLPLDESLVEPVPIPESSNERTEAVHAIYGSDMDPETAPFEDPVKALQADKDAGDMPERIRSPSNLYEALQSNFLKSNYKTPIYRLFLLGTHDENLSHFIEWNKEAIDFINVQSYTEQLMGVLCVYEYYYIHVIEGSEDNLTKLMHKYANELEPSGFEWDLKFHHKSAKYKAKDHMRFHTIQSWVLGIFRIQQRQLNNWRGEKVFPNRMYYEDIPPGGFRERYFHFIRRCMIMVFTYNRMTPGPFNPIPDNNEDFQLTPQMRKTIERAKIQRFKSLGKVVTPITFIQYVIDHKDNPKQKIRSIREHLELFGGTPAYVSSSNTEWPAPGRIAPYD